MAILRHLIRLAPGFVIELIAGRGSSSVHQFMPSLNDGLRGWLRDWVKAMLNECRRPSENFLPSGPGRLMWTKHLSGKRN